MYTFIVLFSPLGLLVKGKLNTVSGQQWQFTQTPLERTRSQKTASSKNNRSVVRETPRNDVIDSEVIINYDDKKKTPRVKVIEENSSPQLTKPQPHKIPITSTPRAPVTPGVATSLLENQYSGILDSSNVETASPRSDVTAREVLLSPASGNKTEMNGRVSNIVPEDDFDPLYSKVTPKSKRGALPFHVSTTDIKVEPKLGEDSGFKGDTKETSFTDSTVITPDIVDDSKFKTSIILK